MKDIFLNSTSKENLIEDLEKVYEKFVYLNEKNEKEISIAGIDFAIDYIGKGLKPGTGTYDIEGKEVIAPEYYTGILCNIRVDRELETLFNSFSSENTKVVTPAQPIRVFA